MLFGVEDIHDMNEQVDLFHLLFVCENIGTEVLSSSDRHFLRKYGYKISELKQKTDYLTYSYTVGKLQTNATAKNQLKQITLKKFKEFVKLNEQRIPVSRAEQANIKQLKQATYNDLKKLANDVKSDLTLSFLEANKTSNFTGKNKVSKKKILTQLKNTLKSNTKKWKNRFELISGYRMHDAYQHGIADELFTKNGPNVRVWYTVHPDACEHCKRVYLFPNGTPKIFYLKNIVLNGSNIGRKMKEALPSVSPIHPRCRCKMNVYIWNTKYDRKSKRYDASKR